MGSRHKDKTLACLLAALMGWAGMHRFYLHGARDVRGWAYVLGSVLYLAIGAIGIQTGSINAMIIVLLPLHVFLSVLEALIYGVSDDEAWDARHNPHSNCTTRSRWPLAVLLVFTFGSGFVVMVAGMARVTDLLYTGGSFG